MLLRVVHKCTGCGDEVTIEQPVGLSRPEGWELLGFDGGRVCVEVCAKCVARVIAAIPLLKSTQRR